MTKIDFFPAIDAEVPPWHDNFKAAVEARFADTGLTEADKAQIAADNAEIHAKTVAANLAAAAHKHATAEKQAAYDHAEANVRGYSRRIKALPTYAPALGSLLGIEGPDVSTDLSHAKPSLSGVDQTGGIIQVSFNKLRSDGINLYGQREGDADWVFLGRATVSPYVDNRPLLQAGKPEQRRYTGVFVKKDQEIGQFSDDLVVTCTP
jgi:hypothetical protein